MIECRADLVMEIIYQLEKQRSYFGYRYDSALLDHLYELHKLRDDRVYSEIQLMLALDDEETSGIIWEMNYA